MKQRIITGIVFTLAVAVFVVPGYWSKWPPLVLFAGVAVIASIELVAALRQIGLKPCLPVTACGGLLMLVPLAVGFLIPERDLFSLMTGFSLLAAVVLFFMVVAILARLLIDGPQALPDAVATAAIMAYVAFPLGCPVLLLDQFAVGWVWVLIGLTAPWVSDVFAYFTGSLIGRRPIVPILSPKKTLEGCLGGIAGSMVLQVVIFQIFRNMLGYPSARPVASIVFALASGLVLSIASQLGDWLASGLKRYCRIKDFGRVLPGHGGLMDRFDSAFFTLPVALVLAMLYRLLGF